MDTLADRVKFLIDHEGLSVTAAAKKCRVPQPRLNDIVLGVTTNPHAKTIGKIAAGLNANKGWIVANEGKMRPDPYGPTESEHHYIKEEVADLTLVEKAATDVINELRVKGQMDLPAEIIAGLIVSTYQGDIAEKEKKANAEAAAKIIEAEKKLT